MPSSASAPPKPIPDGHNQLRDFRTNPRMLILAALAIPVGVVSALMAKLLLWLIAEITNLVFFQRFGDSLPPLENHHLGAWIIAAPVVGALIIGLMARYGSEKKMSANAAQLFAPRRVKGWRTVPGDETDSRLADIRNRELRGFHRIGKAFGTHTPPLGVTRQIRP